MSGRTALVTGAARGIGAAVAARLLDRGFRVLDLSLDPPSIRHERLTSVRLDLTDLAAVREAAGEVAAGHAVTHLVHNAGAIRPALLPDVEADDVAALTALHVTAPLILTQAVLPAMEAARFGRIVFVTSRAALGVPTRSAYSATKAAVHGLVRTWALELGPMGVTANCVAPGPILTDNFWDIVPRGSERERRLAEGLPVRRLGTAEDVAHAAMYLLHDAAGFVTGQTLYVCGGASVGTVTI